MIKKVIAGGVLGTTDVAELVTRALILKKKTSPRSIRNLILAGRIPARRSGTHGHYQLDPEQVENWLHGGDCASEFYVAFVPDDALQQVRDLVCAICDPENCSDGTFFEGALQQKLCTVLNTLLTEPRYSSVLPQVSRVIRSVVGNPAFNCLSTVPGLFE